MFESTQIIGERQYLHAMELLRNAVASLHDYRVSFRHSFINMANLTVALHNGTVVRTCPAALGYSFAAVSAISIRETCENNFYEYLTNFISLPIYLFIFL